MLETPRLYDLQPIAVEAVDPDPCGRCGAELPPHAVYCTECGVCLLDITGGGTVIARLEDFDLDIEVDEPQVGAAKSGPAEPEQATPEAPAPANVVANEPAPPKLRPRPAYVEELVWSDVEIEELIEDLTEELQPERGNTDRYPTIDGPVTEPVAVLPARTGDTVVSPVPLAG